MPPGIGGGHISSLMPKSPEARRTYTAVHVVLAALFAGTAFYLVPALALSGSYVTAAVAAVLGLGGSAAIWLVHRREVRRAERVLEEERSRLDLYRALVEHGTETFLVLDAAGGIRYASHGAAHMIGSDPREHGEAGALLDRVRPADRRRVLHAYARLRQAPGETTAVDVEGWYPDGSECQAQIRATNLLDDSTVRGILVSLRDRTPRRSIETGIQHLAFYDALTGVANRRFFFEQGGKALALARRRDQAAAVFYLDLDRFRQVNEVLGHEHGDALLSRVADALRRSLRDSDVIARLGGDEFGVVLVEVRDAAAAGRVAHRLLESLPSAVEAEGRQLAVGASIGVALFPEDAADLEDLLKAADLAMHRAKSEGGGAQFYRPELRGMLAEQIRLEHDMRRALEHHEFHLHYQPVFHIASGEMAGAEALTRWRHFTRGTVVASEFIHMAERSGLVRSLDRWAIARAVQQRRTLMDGDWPGWVAVNLSPLSLADPDLPDFIRETLRAAGLEPGSLVLEVPETALAAASTTAIDLMWDLKNTGAAIALDDFGTGATSLAQLRQLPIDILKLHADFVRGIGGDGSDEQLLEGALSIAHGIRAKVLAKGVERDDQIDWLRGAGCDFVQGFLVGAPVPAEDLQRAPKAGERTDPRP